MGPSSFCGILALGVVAITSACTVDTSGLDGKQFRCMDGVSCPSGTTCVNFLCERSSSGGADARLDSGTQTTADLSCLGNDLGTMASNPIVIEGELTNNLGGLVPNSRVTLFDTNGAQLATATADEFGDYSISIPSNNKPVDGYLEVTDSGYLTTRYVPPSPFTGVGARESATDIQLATANDVSQWYTEVGLDRASSSGTLRVRVADCIGDAIENAAVAFSPVPELIIDAGDGELTALNQPTASPVTVTGSVGNATFRMRTLPAFSNSPDILTTMTITP